MTIKGAYIAHAERHGDLVAIRLKGDETCLWLDMYLDLAQWQMTCDSDIGCYAYRFAKPRDAGGADFIGHFCSVAVNDGWLLRKCVDEMHLPKDFNAEKSAYALRDMVEDAGADKEYQNKLDEIIDAAYAYDGNKDAWLTAIHIGADSAGIDLPEEWWECLTAGYTPRQRYFARLCSEVIAPELRRMMKEDGINGD